MGQPDTIAKGLPDNAILGGVPAPSSPGTLRGPLGPPRYMVSRY